MNSRHSCDLRYVLSYFVSSAPINFIVAKSRRLVCSHKRLDKVASLLKVAPLPMLIESGGQTEDGHAMKYFGHFYPFQNLSHAVRGCNETVNKYALV